MIKNPFKAIGANLSLKLMSLFLGGGLLLAAAIGGLTEFGFERHFVNQVQPHFRYYISGLAKELGSPPSIEKAKQLTQTRPLVIRIFSEQVAWGSDGLNTRPGRIKRHDKHESHKFKDDDDLSPQKHRHARRFYHDNGTMFILKQVPGYELYFGFKLRSGSIAWFPVLACLFIMLGLVGFYFATRWLFLPVQKIQEGVRLIGEGQVGHQIVINRSDELGQLAGRVNKMSTDLAQMLKAKRDMLLALSHELKSPLARSRVSLALLNSSDIQANLLSDQIQIERLIDEVLESERAHQDHALLHRKQTNILELVNTVLQQDLVSATINKEVVGTARSVNVDTGQIRRLLRNLLENAVHYHRPERGEITLGLHFEPKQIRIIIEDKGEGIAAEHLQRLTEPFYRADPARAQNTGGLGLGLYLCQNIVDAHKGSLDISSELGAGTQVHVILPA